MALPTRKQFIEFIKSNTFHEFAAIYEEEEVGALLKKAFRNRFYRVTTRTNGFNLWW
jgi:hypothetical protein